MFPAYKALTFSLRNNSTWLLVWLHEHPQSFHRGTIQLDHALTNVHLPQSFYQLGTIRRNHQSICICKNTLRVSTEDSSLTMYWPMCTCLKVSTNQGQYSLTINQCVTAKTPSEFPPRNTAWPCIDQCVLASKILPVRNNTAWPSINV